MAEQQYKGKNQAIKRILQEAKEMQSLPSDDIMSLPLEGDIFEWQFAIRGPPDTEFEGGIYHGRIQLPPEYPFKPPSFMLLTPSGRFETQTKICLSISNYHPEHWQPSWSVRTALVALIAFMPTKPDGAYGSLDQTKEDRRILAIKSREAAPRVSNPERQKLIDQIHEYMLSKAPPSKALEECHADGESEAQASSKEARDVASDQELQNPSAGQRIIQRNMTTINMNHSPAGVAVSRQAVTAGSGTRVLKSADDRLFTWAAVGLTIAIILLLVKKFMESSGHGALFMDAS